MDEIFQAIIEMGCELHPDRVEAIASEIAVINSVEGLGDLELDCAIGAGRTFLERLESVWKRVPGFTPLEMAAALRTACKSAAAHSARSSVELVWTGPSTGLVPIRHTEQVLCQIIESARKRLFVVSFVAYKLNLIEKALQAAMNRQVQVTFLVEPSIDHGGKVSVDSAEILKNVVPNASVYTWSGGLNHVHSLEPQGSVHAKCAVADGELAFITSANLSTAAMERNMEMGVLIRGGHVPEALHRHLEALVQTKIVKKV